MILRNKYNEDITQEFLKTYVNSRYYNINEESSRAFYLKITDSLTKKQDILNVKYEDDENGNSNPNVVRFILKTGTEYKCENNGIDTSVSFGNYKRFSKVISSRNKKNK